MAKKLKCRETGRTAVIVKTASQNDGEVLVRYADGEEVALIPFELEVKYEGYAVHRRATINRARDNLFKLALKYF